jgi:hypothetical protein
LLGVDDRPQAERFFVFGKWSLPPHRTKAQRRSGG